MNHSINTTATTQGFISGVYNSVTFIFVMSSLTIISGMAVLLKMIYSIPLTSFIYILDIFTHYRFRRTQVSSGQNRHNIPFKNISFYIGFIHFDIYPLFNIFLCYSSLANHVKNSVVLICV